MRRFCASTPTGQTGDNTLLAAAINNAAASPTSRLSIDEIIFGMAVTPADTQLLMAGRRTTTGAGTSTSVTPAPLGPDPATAATAGKTYTVNPTLSDTVFNFPVNGRGTFRWLARDEASEIVVAATQHNGFGLQPVSPSPTASNIACNIFFKA